MMLRFWAWEMALSTQKVGSFQKQQLCSRRQVVAISRDCSSLPETSPSKPRGSPQMFSSIWRENSWSGRLVLQGVSDPSSSGALVKGVSRER